MPKELGMISTSNLHVLQVSCEWVVKREHGLQ